MPRFWPALEELAERSDDLLSTVREFGQPARLTRLDGIT